MKTIIINTCMLILFLNTGNTYAQYESSRKTDNSFLISSSLITIPNELIGTWEITDPKAADKDETAIKPKDYMIIRSNGSRSFIMQVIKTSSYSSEVTLKLYKGTISKIDDMKFVNLKEISMKSSSYDDTETTDYEDDSYATYSHYKLELKGTTMELTDVFTSYSMYFNSQEEYTQFVKKNMNNSFFYKHQYGEFSDEIYLKD